MSLKSCPMNSLPLSDITIDGQGYLHNHSCSTMFATVMDLLSSYGSLVGGIAWTLLTRSDVAVHVGFLQRNAHAPRVKHFRAANTVVRWMKRRSCVLLHVAVVQPWSLIVMPDSAFKATEPDCLATRACVIVLGTSGATPTLPAGGPVGIVE